MSVAGEEVARGQEARLYFPMQSNNCINNWSRIGFPVLKIKWIFRVRFFQDGKLTPRSFPPPLIFIRDYKDRWTKLELTIRIKNVSSILFRENHFRK